MGRSASLSSRTIIACSLCVILAMALGCAAKKLSVELMPTPIALTLDIPHPGGDFIAGCDCADDAIPVYVMSGRNLEDPNRTPDPFGKERSNTPTLGVAYVTVGANLTPQELHEETTSAKKRKRARVVFDRIELSQAPLELDPWRVKDNAVRFQENPWVQAINAQLDRSGGRNVTIFVHGYNTEFIDNTLIAGEIFHYIGRKGAMISFEWPSESRLLGYIADKGNAAFSTRHFRALISNIAKECNVDSITIIAHSAGSPIVVNALRELRLLEFDLPKDQLQEKYSIGRVVLAAPDMDLMAFTNAVQDRFFEMTNGVAVYASPKDRALGLSEKLYNSSRLGRAVGKIEPWERGLLQLVPQIEMVDASVAEKEFGSVLGHSYFFRDPWVSSDIGSFILGRSPAERGLVKKQGDQVFWEFPTDYPEQLQKRFGRNRASNQLISGDCECDYILPAQNGPELQHSSEVLTEQFGQPYQPYELGPVGQEVQTLSPQAFPGGGDYPWSPIELNEAPRSKGAR